MFEEHDQKNPQPQQGQKSDNEPSDIFRDVAENADQQFEEIPQDAVNYEHLPKQGNPQIILYIVIGVLGVLVLVLTLVLVFAKLRAPALPLSTPEQNYALNKQPTVTPNKIPSLTPFASPNKLSTPSPIVQYTATPTPSHTITSTPSGEDNTDTDKDGLTNSEEEKLGTKIDNIDSDSDGLSDREEVRVYKTNPLNNDSDNDTYKDGEEIKNGYNPLGSGKLIQAPQ